jgi:sodium/potassium/calcium exchanger 2
VSFGLAILLSVVVTVLLIFGSTDNGAKVSPRRLEEDDDDGSSNFFKDAFIDHPYGDADNKYWIFIHILVIAYMLLGLNTVCDLYFTGALDEMVNKWNIKPDVAGATFMAAGGSAPELFTSLIGATISQSDVGFGTIVGSAVFNVLFVIGLCGSSATIPIKLTWWPLFRDCTYYIFGLTMLAIFARNGRDIDLLEAFLLFIFYLGYCVLMYFNEQLEARFVQKKSDPVVEIKTNPVIPVIPVQPPVIPVQPPPVIIADTGSTCTPSPDPPSEPAAILTPGMGSSDRTDHERHHIKKSQPHFERKSMVVRDGISGRGFSKDGVLSIIDTMDNDPGAPVDDVPEPESAPSVLQLADEEEEEDDIDALLEKPEGTLPQAIWFACLPIYAALYYGIPKPSERWFLATFSISLLWIAGFSFWLVYCVEILGEVIGIPVIVMGFTLLAAGTSIPDLVSSMAVARAGEGDMAVSSSIGSNIFDILVGLPIPWMIKILFVETWGEDNAGFTVTIKSEFIVLYVLILVVMVFCVVLSIHMLNWYLNKTLGAMMAVLYAVFLTFVLIIEAGVCREGETDTSFCNALKF